MSEHCIQAVLVLYNMLPAESPAYQSFAALLRDDHSLHASLQLIVCDNTPGASRVGLVGGAEYHHDPTNPGLAKHYNRALQRAAEEGAQWLMLLDQDTMLHRGYMDEVLRSIRQYDGDPSVVALAPRLAEDKVVHSPHGDLTGQTPEALPESFSGIAPVPLHVFNSGAVVRVSALQAIGGFPEKFWLDFLDHATFHLLQQNGGRLYVMQSQLQHQLSTNAVIRGWDRGYLARHWNLLQAEHEFYSRYGTARQKRLYRMRLLRHAFGSLKHMRLPMVWQSLRILVRS